MNTVNITVYKLAAPGLERLKKEIINMPGPSEDFLQQLNEKKTVVLYNKDNVFLTTLAGNTQHIILESNDRKLLEFLAKHTTEVPQVGLQNKSKVKVCKTIIKELWKLIKEVWIAYEIKEEICSWEDDGTPTPSNPNSGGTAPIPGESSIPGIHHNRQGGNFNHIANKYRK